MRILLTSLCLLICLLPVQAKDPGKAVSDFGFEYFRHCESQDNIVVSPLSLHAAFSMLCLGTSGETRSESLKVLGLDQRFSESYREFLQQLEPQTGNLSLASRVWPSKKTKLLPSFTEACLTAFGAKPVTLSYGDPERARAIINAWVSEQTQGMIKELIPRNGVDSSTKLALTNALYFEGQWASPFIQGSTKTGEFHTPDKTVQVPMMKGAVKAVYTENEDFHLLSLPYTDSPIAMALFIPKGKNDWKRLKAGLDGELLVNLGKVEADNDHADFSSAKISLTMPKFKVSQASAPIPLLNKMGLQTLLGPNPDFSKLTTAKGLQVSDCFHEAVVEVDEKGTKASAATAIILSRSGPRQSIVIDHPFFFAIYDRQTLAPLFLGQVTNPTQ